MKPNIRALHLIFAATFVAMFLVYFSRLGANGADEPVDPKFSYVIPHELGASGFFAGDQITITEVRGDKKHIEPGGSYLVEGTYTLASADSADLALFCTSRGPSGPTPVQAGQTVKISRGTGKFHLYETNVPGGWLHVSFYANNSSHGGVYFGEKDRENTIMRNQGWFHNVGDKQHETETGPENKANLALMAYLGHPVPPPSDMDARYDKENLLKAFTALCRNANLVITKLAVDDSEFPFLVYGTLEGIHSLPEKSAFEEQKGYTYGGSVRGSDGEGTYFAVNMVPSDKYPEGQQKACQRRLMLRLQMLADKAQQAQ
ncbi:MAG TPA: hypothetical protein VFB72_00715 [Verrucomicrobiae bacterium]|nr:hypothetical protein [Verrucomicrobiae bacterium]